MSAVVVVTIDELIRIVEKATTRASTLAVDATLKRFDIAAEEQYLNKKAAARLLGVGTSSIDNYVKQSKLHKYRYSARQYRYKRSELLALVSE